MEGRIGSVVINCTDLERMREFWTALTGYESGPLVEDGYFVVLRDPERRVNLSLQKVRGGTIGRNQMHFDFYVPDEEAAAAAAVELGATRVRKNEDPEDTYVVLSDPEGNEFCMCRAVPATSPEGGGEAGEST
jgi:catechol 2,3-dioxygenase-like lactoylglutathione lyase family enzyme